MKKIKMWAIIDKKDKILTDNNTQIYFSRQSASEFIELLPEEIVKDLGLKVVRCVVKLSK